MLRSSGRINATIFTLLALLFVAIPMQGQSPSDNGAGRITIEQPWHVERLITRHKDFLKRLRTIEGFRVQLFSSSQLEKVSREKLNFMSEFDDVMPYVVYDEPDFKLRVGNFQTRLEAYGFLQKVRELYPTAFIVLDYIEIAEL